MDRFEKDDGEIQHGDHSLDDEDDVSDEEPNLPTEAKSPEEKAAEENAAEENSAEDESGPGSALEDFGGAEEGDLCTTEEEEEDEGTCWPRKRERLVTLSNAPNMMAHAGQPLPEDSDEDSAAVRVDTRLILKAKARDREASSRDRSPSTKQCCRRPA